MKIALFAALLLAVPTMRAEKYFAYDKADKTLPTASLKNQLAYDGSVAVDGDKTFVTWMEFVPAKGDVIWFGSRDANGKWIEKQQVTSAPGDFANPTVTLDAENQLWLTYEGATKGLWNVFAQERRNGKFSEPVRVSTNDGASVNHAVAASPKGGIWIAWQGDNHGQFDIFARRISELSALEKSAAMQISETPRGDWHPSITVTPDDDVFVAWDSYDGTAYNIHAREVSNGTAGRTFYVTSGKTFQANAQIISDKSGRIWILWEEDGPNWGGAYRVRTDGLAGSSKITDEIGSVHRFRKLHLAELDAKNEQLRTREIPQNSFAEAIARTNAPDGVKQLGAFYQGGQLAVDGQNRLWIVYRHFYMPLMGITKSHHVQEDWGIFARCLEDDSWSPLFTFDTGQGDAMQRIFAAPAENGVSLAWTFGRTDRRNPQNYEEDALAPDKVVPHVATRGDSLPDAESVKNGTVLKRSFRRDTNGPKNNTEVPSNGRGVALAQVKLEKFLHDSAAKTETISIAGKREAVAPKTPRPVFNFNGKHYELFYGDLHRHTDISLCFWPADGTMDDAYRYGIDAAPLDFLGVTDHTHDIAWGDPLSLLWQRIRKEVNRHELRGAFVPFYSYERSRSDTDHNVISLRGDMLRPHTYPHSEFWKELDTNTITIPHQPFNSVLWKTNDRVHRPVMEIYQGFRNHTCEEDAKKGLASGNEVGFIASSDHLSTGVSFACVWAEEATRESVFRALQARRTFAATDKILLRATCGEHWMGEKFSVKEMPEIHFDVLPTAEIKTAQVFIDGEPKTDLQKTQLAEKIGDRSLVRYSYTPEKSLTGSFTVFVRITQVDGNMAWSSPMWINIEP